MILELLLRTLVCLNLTLQFFIAASLPPSKCQRPRHYHRLPLQARKPQDPGPENLQCLTTCRKTTSKSPVHLWVHWILVTSQVQWIKLKDSSSSERKCHQITPSQFTKSRRIPLHFPRNRDLCHFHRPQGLPKRSGAREVQAWPTSVMDRRVPWVQCQVPWG